MEESNPKSLTINDILDQLTKPSVIQPPEAVKPAVPIAPKDKISITDTPPQSVRPSATSNEGIRLPHLGKVSDSKTDSTSSSNPLPQNDFRMSIRTMSADMTRLKQGQAPQVFELNKPTLQSQKAASAQNTPIPKPAPPPPLPKPIPKQPAPSISAIPIPAPRPTLTTPSQDIPRPLPSQSFKPSPRPSANIPNTTTPAPLPSEQLPAHIPGSKEAEHHHTERIISTDSLPGFPGAPIPKKTAKLPDEKVEYGLIAKIIGSGMTTGIISTIVIAIATYFLVTYFFFNQQDEIITATPTPTQPILTTTPVTNELENIFRAIPTDDFYIPDNKEEAIPTLISFIKSKILERKEFRKIAFIKSPNQSQRISEFTELLDAISLQYPSEFKDSINPNHLVLFYGQEERLEQGIADESPKRIVMVVEIKDIEKTTDIMKRWEPTMPENFKNLFEIDPTKKASQTFLDNQYRGTKIRYQNFPLPDKSVDYAIVSSLTGRHYLIITNSRESAYSPIDRIKGL